jgi:hypothetical protein
MIKKLILILMLAFTAINANALDDSNITANPEVFLPITVGTAITAVGAVLDLSALALILGSEAGLVPIATTAVIGTGLLVSGAGIVLGGVATGLIEWAEGE